MTPKAMKRMETSVLQAICELKRLGQHWVHWTENVQHIVLGTWMFEYLSRMLDTLIAANACASSQSSFSACNRWIWMDHECRYRSVHVYIPLRYIFEAISMGVYFARLRMKRTGSVQLDRAFNKQQVTSAWTTENKFVNNFCTAPLDLEHFMQRTTAMGVGWAEAVHTPLCPVTGWGERDERARLVGFLFLVENCQYSLGEHGDRQCTGLIKVVAVSCRWWRVEATVCEFNVALTQIILNVRHQHSCLWIVTCVGIEIGWCRWKRQVLRNELSSCSLWPDLGSCHEGYNNEARKMQVQIRHWPA